MKQSRYNFKHVEPNGVILYNTATDGILQLNNALAELADKYADNINALHDVYPELFNALEKFGFVVDDNVDEVECLIERWTKRLSAKGTFRLTVNPTLNCNLCCWYCYENHSGHKVMSDDTLCRVKRLLRKKIQDEQLKTLHLDFFGGEPLLQYDRIVYPLIRGAYGGCKEYDKEFHLSFTTNGTLLTPKRLGQISELLESKNEERKTVPSFQITLDGNEEFHNRVRRTTAGDGSYQTIMTNVKAALSHGFDIFVRFNTTNENIDSYLDVIDDFADIPKEQTQHVRFDLQKVWQDNASQLTREKLVRLRNELTDEGYHVAIQNTCNKHFCYADQESSVVVNYDGYIYKCTAREFVPELAEGTIDEEGNISYNNRYSRRMSLRFGNNVCRQCNIYPICHGGCTQDKLENGGQEKCLRQYSDEKRKEIIEERLQYLISNRKK